MSIQLKPEEQKLRAEIEDLIKNARAVFQDARRRDEAQSLLARAGAVAHELHMALKRRGHEPRHHAYMIKNRELPADHEEFYVHFHPLEDLLKFLDDEHANDDPVDQTIGAEFAFRVYSRRWGHDDTYTIKRTADGWTVSHMSIGGPCDKGGRPFLFENLKQDLIQFPEGLASWMEWLWDQAATEGLALEKVQEGLQQLAEWVNITERNAPQDGVWEGY